MIPAQYYIFMNLQLISFILDSATLFCDLSAITLFLVLVSVTFFLLLQIIAYHSDVFFFIIVSIILFKN